ncbi:MAG: hypothetical protein DRR19_23105 [Candidatus Parabeggiatoa sp. nov. 1]|nr:MAG: hypothetical protein DRR19_23105 [Gammaproteobacteria bacterium]
MKVKIFLWLVIAVVATLSTPVVWAKLGLERTTIGNEVGTSAKWWVTGVDEVISVTLHILNLGDGEEVTEFRIIGSSTPKRNKGTDALVSYKFDKAAIYTVWVSSSKEESNKIVQIVGPAASDLEKYESKLFTGCDTKKVYDVIVVDGTSAGIGAAITAAREGLSTCLLESTSLLGGMFTNGIGKSDLGLDGFADLDSRLSYGLFDELRKKATDSLSQEEIAKIEKGYLPDYKEVEKNGNSKAKNQAKSLADKLKEGFKYRPSVVRNALYKLVEDAVKTNGLDVQLNTPFDKAEKDGENLKITAKGETYEASYVIDATDSADVVASLFKKLEKNCCVVGDEDGKVQAYSYVMTIQDHGSAEKNWSYMAIPPHDKCDPEKYTKVSVMELFSEVNKDGEPVNPGIESYWTPNSGNLGKGIYQVKHHKLLGANPCPKGDELHDENAEIANASNDAGRVDAFERYIDHSLCFLYSMQRLTRRDGTKDEGIGFTSEYPLRGNFPARLYVREGRRIIAKTKFEKVDAEKSPNTLERPTQTSNKLRQSIGVVTYTMDSHSTDPNSGECPHGNFLDNLRRTGPGVIPLGIMFPESLDNVLVPLAVSSSHEGYSTLRMDPTRMNMGMAAALAIKVSMEKGIKPPDLLKPESSLYLYELQIRLIKRGGRIFLYSDPELHPNTGNSHNGKADIATQFLGIWGNEPKSSDYSFGGKFENAITEFKNLGQEKVLAPYIAKHGKEEQIKEAWEKFSDAIELDPDAIEVVLELFNLKVIGGNPDGTFAPKREVNRAELSKMIYLTGKLVGRFEEPSKEYCNRKDFSDVRCEEDKEWPIWYTPFILELAAKKVVKGYSDGTFKPGKPINFAEMAKMVTLGIGLLKEKNTTTSNEKTTVQPLWFIPYVDCAKQEKLLPDVYGNSDIPIGTNVTREQTAQMIYNAYRVKKDKPKGFVCQ